MTYRDLARYTGCSYWTVCSILTGRRNASPKLAERLAAAVKGTEIIDWIFARKFNKKLARLVRAA